MRTAIVILALISLSSCNFLLMKLTGTKQPKQENYNSIYKYAASLGLDPTAVLFAKDSIAFAKIGLAFGGFQNILIFDRNNKFIPYRTDTSHCNASVDDLLEQVCKISELKIETELKICLDSLTNLLVDPNQGDSVKITPPYDYIILMDFAKYFDGVNKTHIGRWNSILKKNHQTCIVKTYFVNLDYLDSWNMKSEIPKMKLKPDRP
ncbi:MAG TPA: hypothetical protein VGC65_11975 [Bacteroidia bacterium]|jgi:hypothetical protein